MSRRILFLASVGLAVAAASSAQCLIPNNLIVSGGPGKDGIPALTSPNVVVSGDASFMLPEDRVLGVVVDGQARAYPHAILWWHEIVNDVLGGKPIAVSFCPLTGSGIVFDAEVDGRVLNFGVSGLLFDNNLILFDRATDSLWSQMQLRSVCGALQGVAPALVPAMQVTWAAWRALHPETTVVSFDTGFSRNYDVYPYGDYDAIDSEQLLFPQTVSDRRLPLKDNVVGVAHEGVARAYSMSRLAESAPRLAVNDNVNGRPVAIVFDADAELGIAFDRTLSTGQTVELEVMGDAFPFQLRDRNSQSTWSLEGEPLSGPLAVESLHRTPGSFVAFWFAWASFNPGSEILRVRLLSLPERTSGVLGAERPVRRG